MTRTALGKFGRYGATVNVFAMTLDGEPVARVEWREGPEKRRRTETFRGTKRDREAAAKAFAEGIAHRLRGTPAEVPVRRTVGDLWTAYCTAHDVDWRPKTRTLNRARWHVWTLHVAPHLWADLVRPETLDQWREALLTLPRAKTGAPMARNQVAHHIQLVKSVWRWATARTMLPENPIADYAVRKGRDYRAQAVPEYTPAQWGAILARLPYRDARRWRAWAAIALDGLLAPRSNALLSLEWGDVDMAARTVRWRGELDKVGTERVQALPRDAVFALRVMRVWRQRAGYTGPYLFFPVHADNRRGRWSYQALNALLHKASREAGVPVVKYRAMHGLRRMVAGNVLSVTGDITKVGDWLGDSDVRTLRRSYLRNRTDGLDAVVGAMTLPTQAADTTGDETATGAATGRPRKTTTPTGTRYETSE